MPPIVSRCTCRQCGVLPLISVGWQGCPQSSQGLTLTLTLIGWQGCPQSSQGRRAPESAAHLEVHHPNPNPHPNPHPPPLCPNLIPPPPLPGALNLPRPCAPRLGKLEAQAQAWREAYTGPLLPVLPMPPPGEEEDKGEDKGEGEGKGEGEEEGQGHQEGGAASKQGESGNELRQHNAAAAAATQARAAQLRALRASLQGLVLEMDTAKAAGFFSDKYSTFRVKARFSLSLPARLAWR
jgi:hypothetical protein